MTAQPTAAEQPAAETVSAAALRAFIQHIFQHHDMRAEDADVLAEHLVWADLHGIPSLGTRKVPQYVQRLRQGGTSATAQPTVVRQHGALTQLDAHDTWGQVVGARGMRMATETAGEMGIGVTLVRNTTSAGALGRLASFAVEAGMIGLAINNGPPLQPVWGAAEKTIGNQAFAIASPAGSHPPLLLDMATSAVTLARLHEYEAEGRSLPAGSAIDADGKPTTDPAAALKGLLLPMGEHRGSGLAVMWEVLTGVLAGGERFLDDTLMPDAYDQPQSISLFLLALDPALVMPPDQFLARVDRLIEHIHAARPAPGVDVVRAPGERSHATAEQRASTGIPIPADLAEQLHRLARELDLSWPGAPA